MGYPYFAATLPMQTFGASPVLRMEDFLEGCRQHLSGSDAAALHALLSGEASSGNLFVSRWRDFETQYRNAVARIRRQRLAAASPDSAASENAFLPREHGGWSVSLENAVTAAFQESNPLRRQELLERVLWDGAGDIAGSADAFSSEMIFVYALRLRIAERMTRVNADSGAARLRSVADAAASSALSGV